MSAATGEQASTWADYEPSAHEVRTALIHLARERGLPQAVQVACDAQTLLDTHLSLEETRRLLGWSSEQLQTAFALADTYVWSTYDDQELPAPVVVGDIEPPVAPPTFVPEENLADVEKIPRQLPIERIFEGVIAPGDVESLMNLPDPQYQEVIRFFKLLLDMTQDERKIPSIELMAPLMLWMRGLRMNEVAGTLGVSRHVLRGNLDTFLGLAQRYQPDIFDLLVSLEHDMRQPQVIAAPVERGEFLGGHNEVDEGMRVDEQPVGTDEAADLDPDLSVMRRALYKVIGMTSEADDETLVPDAELVVEPLNAENAKEPQEDTVEAPEDVTEEPPVEAVADAVIERESPRKLTSAEVIRMYQDELGIDLSEVLDMRVKDFNAEALEIVRVLRTSITGMREWHKTTLGLDDEEHRRLNTLLGIDVRRNNRGIYEVTDSKLGPRTLLFIRKAAANGRRATSDVAHDAVNSSLAKLYGYLNGQKDKQAS